MKGKIKKKEERVIQAAADGGRRGHTGIRGASRRGEGGRREVGEVARAAWRGGAGGLVSLLTPLLRF